MPNRLPTNSDLAQTPGPSPWYLRLPEQNAVGSLRWVERRGDKLAGISELRNPAGEALILLDFNCYVLRRPEGLLIWHDSRDLLAPALEMVLVDPVSLHPIESVSAAAAEMRERKASIYISGEPIVQHAVPTSLPAGENRWDPPTEFEGFPELLVLVHGSAGGVRPDFFNTVYLTLWSMRPAIRTIEVQPQRWFNEGAYDFGYQWVTRIARGANGELVGEGFRLQPFVLDETGTQVRQWLPENPFRTEWNAA